MNAKQKKAWAAKMQKARKAAAAKRKKNGIPIAKAKRKNNKNNILERLERCEQRLDNNDDTPTRKNNNEEIGEW